MYPFAGRNGLSARGGSRTLIIEIPLRLIWTIVTHRLIEYSITQQCFSSTNEFTIHVLTLAILFEFQSFGVDNILTSTKWRFHGYPGTCIMYHATILSCPGSPRENVRISIDSWYNNLKYNRPGKLLCRMKESSAKNVKRVVIKVGTSTLTHQTGR